MADSPSPTPTPTPLTSDALVAAFAAAGVTGDNAPAVAAGTVALVNGLAALGVNTPDAVTAFLTTASRLVRRETLNAQIAALQAQARQQQQDNATQQQALQAQIATLQAEIGS